MRNRLIVVSRLDDDFVNLGGNVLGQVGQQDLINARSGIAGVEHGLPLHEARWRNLEFGAGRKIDTRPRAPVAIGIVDVAAARIKLDVSGAAHAGAPPKRKDVRVEDIAFVRAFRLGARAKDENFPQVAAGCVEASAGRGGESGDLRGAGFDQIGEIVDAVDGEDVTAIAGAGEQASVLVEAERVDEIFMGSPQA